MLPKLRNLLLATALFTVFAVLLLAKLSPLQGYVLAGCFISLAAYTIVLGLRD
jgi:hypothetical protein